MIRKQFFTDTDDGYAAIPVQSNFNGFWNRVEEAEKASGLSVDNALTKEQYATLLNLMGFRKRADFFTCKTFLGRYVDYLVRHGVLPESQTKMLRRVSFEEIKLNKQVGVVYFKDLPMLRAKIEEAVRLSGSHDENLYDMHATILYLTWFGLSMDEIINLRKDDVLDDGILLNGKKMVLPYSVCNVLARCRDAVGYSQQAKGVIFMRYQASEYLLRSRLKPQLNSGNIRSMLCALNRYADFNAGLRLDVVCDSGLFNRLYQLERESVDFPLDNMEFAESATGKKFTNVAVHKNFLEEYKLYKQWFEG